MTDKEIRKAKRGKYEVQLFGFESGKWNFNVRKSWKWKGVKYFTYVFTYQKQCQSNFNCVSDAEIAARKWIDEHNGCIYKEEAKRCKRW